MLASADLLHAGSLVLYQLEGQALLHFEGTIGLLVELKVLVITVLQLDGRILSRWCVGFPFTQLQVAADLTSEMFKHVVKVLILNSGVSHAGRAARHAIPLLRV